MICGWGTEARVFASIASSVKGTKVRVLPDRWNMPTNDFKITFHRNGEKPTCNTCKLPQVERNPEDAIKGVDIVVFMLPDSSHKDLLQEDQGSSSRCVKHWVMLCGNVPS